MIFLLSPAKSLDYETPVSPELTAHKPLFVASSVQLIDVLKTKTPAQIATLMDLSDNDLLDLFLARKSIVQVEATLDSADFHEILKMVRETR